MRDLILSSLIFTGKVALANIAIFTSGKFLVACTENLMLAIFAVLGVLALVFGLLVTA